MKSEIFYTNEYIYDFEVSKCNNFYANNCLVHNTDSCYIELGNGTREEIDKITEEIIRDIKKTLPFPQDTFDMSTDADIKYLYFFKGEKKNDSDDGLEPDDIEAKKLGFLKKNYIYVDNNGEVTIKNLGIKKKSNSKLSKKIFWEYLIPDMKLGNCVFKKAYIRNLIITLLEKDYTLASMRKNVGTYAQYQKTSPDSLSAQIAKTYGHGIHFLIPNTMGKGVGKGKKYCTVEEFKNYKFRMEHIDTTNVWKELKYFIKAPVTKNIFEFGVEK